MGKNSDQGAYWREREAAWEKEYESQEADYGRHIRESYDRMIRWCDTQINDFYARYADREGVSIADAKERVSKADMEAYAKKAEQYCRDAAADRAKYGHTRSTASYFSDQANAEMRLYNLTMKVNRLEMLKANIGLETVRSFDELDMFFEEALNHRSMDELQHFSGLLGKYVTEPQKNARSIVDASFRGATFSDRIWRHQDALKFELAKELERGLIAGNSSTELARDIRKIFGTSQSNAERLLRTELCRVQIDSQQKAYEENGVEYFEFIGGQSGACDECSRLNGTVEKVEKMRPGLNAPPLHPKCRCSTAPYMDRKAFDEWLNGIDTKGRALKASGASNDWSGTQIRKHDSKTIIEIEKYIERKGFRVGDISKFDGEPDLLKKQVDELASMKNKYGKAMKSDIKVSVAVMDDSDFAETLNGDHVRYNTKALRNKRMTESNIQSNPGTFSFNDFEGISRHESGHLIEGKIGKKGFAIAKKAYYNVFKEEISDKDFIKWIRKSISEYAAYYHGLLRDDLERRKYSTRKYEELTPEILAKSTDNSEFRAEFLRLLMREALK